MVPALAAQRCRVVLTTAAEMARACASLLDDMTAGRLPHAGQPQLDAAIAGVRKRPVGVAGAFAWDRRDGSVFVAPLVAGHVGAVRCRDGSAPEQSSGVRLDR